MRAEIEFLTSERSQQFESLCSEINSLKHANSILAAEFNQILSENLFFKEHSAKLFAAGIEDSNRNNPISNANSSSNAKSMKEYCEIIEMELSNKLEEIQRNKTQIAQDEMMIARLKETITSLSTTVA